MSSFAADLGVSVTAVKRWLSVLEAGRIINLLPPHFNNPGNLTEKSYPAEWENLQAHA